MIGLVGFSANSAFSQQVKKKIVRVIEDDGKGEKVVKEYDITNNKQKFDSITRDVHKKMKIEQKKIDSLEQVLMISLPNHLEIPDMPDFNFDMPEAPFFGSDNDFEIFAPEPAEGSTKIYYSEKNLDKSGNLDKILEDLEKGTFDPQKWNMKEVEKDKIKDFKTNGKGEVIVFGNRSITPPNIQYFRGNPHRNGTRAHVEMRRGGRGNRMIYINGDSLNNKDFETYTFESSDDSDGDACEKTIIISPDGKRTEKTFWGGDDDGHKNMKGHRMVIYSNDSVNENGKMKTFTVESTNDSNDADGKKVIVVTSDGKKGNVSFNVNDDSSKDKRMIVIVNDDKTTKFEFTKPSVDDFKMLEKSDLMKEDKTKLLSPESLMLIPKKEKDKYGINFQSKEFGKVKVIIADNNGKSILSEEFDYTKGKLEKEVEIKDLKSGVYFIQAQLNGKTTTSKLEIKID